MNRVRRITAAILSLLLLLFAGCSAPVSTTQPEQSAAFQNEIIPENTWVVSDLKGSVTADTRASIKDDFHTAINKDWLSSAEILKERIQANSFIERNIEITEQIKSLMTDETQTGHEAQLVRTLYSQLTDMNTRNALGMKPVQPYINEIMALNTLEDVTRYILNNENNMSETFLSLSVEPDYKDSTKNKVYLGAPFFSLKNADEYRNMTSTGELAKSANETMLCKLLVHAGFTEIRAKDINDKFFALESQIAVVSLGTEASIQPDFREKIYNPVTIDELAALSPAYPVTELLKPFTDAGVDTFILTEPEWLKKMNELYTEDNLELIKAYLLRGLLTETAELLDRECLDILDEGKSITSGTSVKTGTEDAAYAFCSEHLDMAVGRMYAENYVSPKTKEDVEELIDKVIAVYRKRLLSNQWLSIRTRLKAIEKLDSLKVRVAYPDDWSAHDYSGLTFKSSDEGGNPVGNVIRLNSYNKQKSIVKAASPTDSRMWIMSPQTVNAGYSPFDNSINIPAGILGGIFYSPDASDEVNMGTIGLIIGHEITHGFDSQGSRFDKDGNLSDWWTDEDKAAFKARTDKVSAFFSRFEIINGVCVNGDLTVCEAVSDLGGMSCMLEIAAGMENFNYRKFFESYAGLWRKQMPAETLEYLVRTDPHLPGYLRTNAIIQQVQEFYDTYGITEGDGMYLAPEARLSVW